MIYNFELVGERIKKERIKSGKSQQAFADDLNISRVTLGKWEKGKAVPLLEDMLKMCNVFNCELGYLLGEYDSKKRIVADLQNETGLSEVAAGELRSINKINQVFAKSAVEHLLSSDDACYILECIGKYLLIDDSLEIELYNGEKIKETAILLIDVQQNLSKLRQQIKSQEMGG